MHLDVKKLANIPDGGGWRHVGRRQGGKNRIVTTRRTGGAKNKYHQPLMGNHHRPHTAIGRQPPISRLTNLPGQHS